MRSIDEVLYKSLDMDGCFVRIIESGYPTHDGIYLFIEQFAVILQVCCMHSLISK